MKSVVAPSAWSISPITRVNAHKFPNSSPPFSNFFHPKPYSLFCYPFVRPLSMAASAAQVYHSLNYYELFVFCVHAFFSLLMRVFSGFTQTASPGDLTTTDAEVFELIKAHQVGCIFTLETEASKTRAEILNGVCTK